MEKADEDLELKRVTVVYLSALREKSGHFLENMETEAVTANDLFQVLDTQYVFELSRDRIRVAINGELCRWGTPVKDQDLVVFITAVGENKEHD